MSNAANTIPAPSLVPVRKFRQMIERAENYVHGHIHSTTTFAELARYAVELRDVLGRMRSVACRRASGEDRERFMITVARAERILLDIENGDIKRKVVKPTFYVVR